MVKPRARGETPPYPIPGRKARSTMLLATRRTKVKIL